METMSSSAPSSVAHSSTTCRMVSTSSSATLKIVPADRSGCSTAARDRGRDVLRVAVVVERQPLVGDDEPPPAVEDAAHDRPLTRDHLVRPVQVRVAEVRRGRVGREHGLLRAHDPVPLLVDGGIDHQLRILPHGHGQARRVVLPRVGPAPIGGHAADGHEVPAPAGREGGDPPQPPVHGHDHVPRPRPPAQRPATPRRTGRRWWWRPWAASPGSGGGPGCRASPRAHRRRAFAPGVPRWDRCRRSRGCPRPLPRQAPTES